MSTRAVRIVGPSGGRELNLPAELPIDPPAGDARGDRRKDEETPLDSSRWRLVRSVNGEGVLARHSSLAESGILNGTTLYLASDVGPAEEPQPATERLSVVARATTSSLGSRWRSRHSSDAHASRRLPRRQHPGRSADADRADPG